MVSPSARRRAVKMSVEEGIVTSPGAALGRLSHGPCENSASSSGSCALAWLVFLAGLGTMGRQVDKRLARQLLATALRATILRSARRPGPRRIRWATHHR